MANELILHPRMRYGTYIISLFNLWLMIREELSHHYRYTADKVHDQVRVDQDVDEVLRGLIEQSRYLDGHAHEPLQRISHHILSRDNHYDITEMKWHQFLADAMQAYFEFISAHIPWLVVTPNIKIDLLIRNRFDLILSIGPVDHP